MHGSPLAGPTCFFCASLSIAYYSQYLGIQKNFQLCQVYGLLQRHVMTGKYLKYFQATRKMQDKINPKRLFDLTIWTVRTYVNLTGTVLLQ